MDLYETLTALCSASGPSGFEAAPAQAAAELLRPLVDEVRTDRLGNVIGLRRCGKPGAKRLVLDAHLDEVGFMVLAIEEGFLRIRTIGGVDPCILPAREVTVLTKPEPIFGVVTCLPPHVQSAGDHDKAATLEDLRVDVGMTQEEAEAAIPIGTPIVYREPLTHLAGQRVAGKALDDRSCFATLLRTAELLREEELDVDLYILGSACEEVGGRGAVTAAYGIMPDYAVAVDVTFARSPGSSEEDVPSTLGSGPAVGLGTIIPCWMTARFREKAANEKIPYTLEVMAGRTGTNGDEFQISREGVATAVLSLPLRYMHTPTEVIDLGDMEQTARLLAAFVRDLGKEGR